MQAGYRRDPNESAKALKAKVKGKKRDTILYGAVIKQQSNLASIGNVPKPPTPPTAGTPSMPGAPVVFSNVNQISGGPLESTIASVVPPNTPTRMNTQSQPMGAIDVKMLQERLSKLKKHDETMVKPSIPTKQQELEATIQTQKSNLKPHDSRVPHVGINTPTASLSDISDVSQMIPVGTPSVTLAPEPATSSTVQDLAKELFNKYNASLEAPRKSISITAYDTNGNSLNYKIQVYTPKSNRGRYTVTSKSHANDMDNVNIPDSINAAINKIANGTLATNLAPGSVNGLGLELNRVPKDLRSSFSESDPTKISSSRIAWMNDRSSGRKLPKGMIYVMGPSLLKGDLRIYNKSGKALMSASKISPAFQRIVRDTIDRNTFDPQDYSSIEPSESADVNHFISISKPITPNGIDRLANADSIWKLKKRYEVLVGELSAGNDGLVVRQEMEAILRSLIRMHAINPVKAKDLIKALHDY